MGLLSNAEQASALFVEQGSDPATPATGNQRLYFKSDGLLYQIDDAGTVTQVGGGASSIDDLSDVDTTTTAPATADAMVWDGTNWVPDGTKYAPAGSRATYAQQTKRTSGNITVNSTSLVNIDTGLDLTLSAKAGDLIEVGLNVWINNEGVYLFLDVATIVAGSPVNYVSTGTSSSATNGVSGFLSVPSSHHQIAGAIFYTVQAGDVSSGTVTLRLRGRTNSATNRVMNATANNPLYFRARNHG